MVDGTEELPPGWAWARLGELGAVTGGLTKNPDRSKWPERAPFLRVANVQKGRLDLADVANIGVRPEELPRVLLKSGDLLVVEGNGSLDQIGRCAVWTGDIEGCVHQNHIIKVRFGQNDLSRWVLHWLTSGGGRAAIERVASSTAGLHTLSISKVEQLPVPVAPTAERTRIMSEIEASSAEMDEAEAALKRARVALVDYRASLLHAACTGDFTAAWRADNPRPVEDGPALLRRILAERRAAWECTEISRQTANGKAPLKGNTWKARYVEPCAPDTAGLSGLPAGWVWASVQQVGQIKLGRQRAPKYHSGSNMRRYLRVANVFENRIDTTNVMQMEFDEIDFENYKLSYGDILLNEGQSAELVGRPAMFRDEIEGCCFTNTLIRYRVAPGVLPAFALLVFRHWMRNRTFQRISKITTNIAHLGAGRFAELPFPLPPTAEQVCIVEQASDLLADCDTAEATFETAKSEAATLRRFILHTAFIGRLVPQASADEPAATLLAGLRAAPAVPGRTPRRARPVQDALL